MFLIPVLLVDFRGRFCVHPRSATSRVLNYNSRKIDNFANDCNCRFWTEMATKRKNCGLQL